MLLRGLPLVACACALSTVPRRMVDGHPVRVITHRIAEATEISVFTRDLTAGVAGQLAGQDALAGQLWPSARALATEVYARLLHAQPSRPTVVELGCGVGMVSLALRASKHSLQRISAEASHITVIELEPAPPIFLSAIVCGAASIICSPLIADRIPNVSKVVPSRGRARMDEHRR